MGKDVAAIRDEALAFLMSHESGVISTVSEEGKPRARQIYYTCDDAFNIYFLTLANTRKVADLAANPFAAFVLSDPATPRTIQVEGGVANLTETAELDPLLLAFIKKLMTNKRFGIPLERFDTAAINFYRIAPNWVRWGDFTLRRGTDQVLTVIDPKETESL